MAALPMVDALYCVTVMLALTRVKERNSSMQLVAIFLGPFAKEVFIFVVPIILLYSHISRAGCWYILSGIVVLPRVMYTDHLAGPEHVDGLIADLHHLDNLGSK